MNLPNRSIAVIDPVTGQIVNIGDAANDAARVVIVGGSSGGASATDDSVYAIGDDSVAPMGALVDETSTNTVAEGNTGLVRMNENRILLAELRTGDGDSAMDEVNDAVRVTLVAGGSSGGTAQADRSAFVDGTGLLTPAGGVYNETATDPTEDQTAAVRITEKRAFHTNLRASDGTEIGTASNPVRTNPTGTTAQPITDNGASLTVDDGGGSLTVDGTVAISGTVAVTDNGGTLSVDDGGGSLTVDGTVAVSSVSGNVTVVQSTATNLKVDASGVAVPVTDNGGTLTVDDGGGSLTVDGTVAVAGTTAAGASLASVSPIYVGMNSGSGLGRHLTAIISNKDTDGTTILGVAGTGWDGTAYRHILLDTAGNQRVSGQVAHDAAIAGNPDRIGARAMSAEYTAVTTGDQADLICDLVGKLIVNPYSLPEDSIKGKTADITDTTDTEVIAAQATGIRIYVTHLLVQNSHATVGTWVNIRDGSTDIYTVYAAPVGGGASITLPKPLRTTAATALKAQCVTTGANVRVSASGYKGV